MGLLPQGSSIYGEILWRGENLAAMEDSVIRRHRWKELALVPQETLNSFTPVLTIGRHIAEVLDIHLGIKKAAAAAKISSLLEEVGLLKIWPGVTHMNFQEDKNSGLR